MSLSQNVSDRFLEQYQIYLSHEGTVLQQQLRDEF